MIHVLNFEDKIIDYISKRDSSIVTAEHSQNIEEDTETFELTLHSDKAENLRRRVKLVVEMLDGTYREFFVSEIEDNVVEKETTLTCVASYLEDLSKAKPIPPQEIKKKTLIEMLDFGLRGTGWDRGNVDYMGEKSRSWTAYATPYEYLKMLRTTFGHEYRFVIEIEGRKVKRRRVDCVKPEPLFNGREIVYGKDLLGMTRSIDMSEVVTAYIGLGPEKDNGDREVVEVVDDEVQESFDLPENYLWGIYEPESEDQDMTKERLTTLTRTALNKAKSRVFSYEVTSLDVKKQFGHELVQIGDIVRIKNRDFKPPIYADGRVIEITSDLMAERQTYKLGEIKEYDENKLRAYFNSIKSLLTKKVNDDINNMNTIIIDNIQDLEIFERNISKGAEPPLNPVENQLWYDTSNPDVAILREYVNGQWINATAEDVRDIGGFTREQTIYNDLNNTMDNLLAQHTQLQTLYDNLYNSEYLVDDVLKQDYKAKYDDLNAQFLIAKNLFDSLDLEHATIGKLMDVQAAIVEYRNKLQAFYLISQQVDKSISERIKLLQSQYTDEKYNEAMEKVASSINGTWNAETGQLVADIPNEARLTELQQQIESTYNQELNSAMATLRNETDSKLVNTKNEISATVAKVDEKITGLTIGGRNLFQSYNSNFPTSINKDIVSTQSFTGRYWATNLYSSDFLKTVLKAGETYTYSYEIEIIGLSEKEVPAVKRHGVIFYSATNTKDNILSYVELEREVGNKYKVSKTFVAPEITDHRFLAYSGFYSDDGTIKYPASSNLVKISNLKLEKGNKATDWTPAPEDTTNKIATAQANAEAAAKAYADAQDALRKTEAQAYADGIVTAEEERAINDAKAKLQEAKSYAEQQKQIAIDTANNNTTSALEPITVRTTNNENSIKTLEEQILLTATKEDVTQQLNTELQPIKTDVNDQKAQLQVMSDEISTKVSMNQYSLDQTSIVEELSKAETERTQLSNQINDRVTITEYNSGMQQKTNEINSAKAYADAQDELKQAEVKAYADGIVTEEEQRAIADAQQKLAQAKADAQVKANNAEASAKSYADGLKQQTNQTLTTYDTRITQNGREISQRATKEEFNASRKTLSQVISELTNSTMNGLTYTYDENGAIQSFNVGPNGTSINTSKLTIDAGDVSLKDGVFTVKSVNTNNVTIPRTDGGVPTILNGTDKRESAITGTTPPFKQKLSGNVPVFYESGYWLGCLKRTTDQEYLSYDAFYFTHDRRYLSVSVIFLVGQKATTDPNERTVGEFIKLEEFSPPPSINSQYLINESKGFATTTSEQDDGGRVQYTFVKDLGPPTGLPRQFYFKVKPNAEGVANPLFETNKPYSMAKFQIRKTILYG